MSIKSFFNNRKQSRLFLLMCMSTLFNLLLLGGRLYHLDINPFELYTNDQYVQFRGSASFIFLVWNLFLAWVPYLISLMLEGVDRHFSSRGITGLFLMCWLCFLPNAPYILTDLLHLKVRSGIPLWYDLMLILSFAWTGLILGYLSLNEVQHFFQKRMGNGISWLLTVAIIALSGFGIYLGRFLRWNSWDVLTNPFQLLRDIAEICLHPLQYTHPLVISGVIGLFLLLGYLPFSTMLGRSKD